MNDVIKSDNGEDLYVTKDLGLAAFLIAKNYSMQRPRILEKDEAPWTEEEEKKEENQIVLCFNYKPEREADVKDYLSGDALVDPRKYFRALRAIDMLVSGELEAVCIELDIQRLRNGDDESLLGLDQIEELLKFNKQQGGQGGLIDAAEPL